MDSEVVVDVLRLVVNVLDEVDVLVVVWVVVFIQVLVSPRVLVLVGRSSAISVFSSSCMHSPPERKTGATSM